MADFLDRLGAELSRAASAEHRSQPAQESVLPFRPRDAGRPRPRWRRRSPGRLALLLAVVVIAAGSAAAALSLTQSSAPLSGSVPPQSAAALGFAHYDFEVFPEIEGGQAGWCVWIYSAPAGAGKYGGMGGCGAGAAGPAISAPATKGSPAQSFAWLMVPERVAAVRLPAGKTVTTVADPRLPAGFRGVAFFVTRQDADPLRAISALDGRGRTIQVGGLGATRSPHALPGTGLEPTSYWTRHQPPAHGRCSISVHRLADALTLWGRMVNHLQPFPGATAGTFLSCASTWLRFRGQLFYSSVLTDAVQPGAPTGALPGLSAVVGDRGVYHRELPSRFIAVNSIQPMVARRTSRGWLVVESVAPLNQRLTVLAALSSP